MARFEDSPDLFGYGAGQGTYGNIGCGWCGKKYHDREDRQGNPKTDESILFTDFGGLQVCECCFEEVEAAVLERMDDIIPWFIRILEKRQGKMDQMAAMIAALRKTLIAAEAATLH